MSVYAPLLGSMWRTLVAYGVDPQTVILERHFAPGRPSRAPARISFEDFDAYLDRAAALIDDPAVGIRVGEFLQPSHFGALGHAFLASASLRNALWRYRHYSRYFNEDSDVRLIETLGSLRVVYRTLKACTRPFVLGDAQLSVLLRLCRMICDATLVPLEVTLKRELPRHAEPWRAYFGPGVRFGQEENSLLFGAEQVDAPLTGADSKLVSIHEAVIEDSLRQLDGESVPHRVRVGLLEQLPTGRVSESELARKIGMSPRTLHRKLKEFGETFRSMLTRVRMELAETYLRKADYSVTDIAFLLGYTNPSAFSRAFRQWYGCSPTVMRERVPADH